MTSTLSTQIENTIIRASAGSGKTWSLSNRYHRLLARGAECGTILATTFTRKAAGEILDRIMTALAIASLDPKETQDFAAQLQLPNADPQTPRRMLRQVMSNLHLLKIGTLDSFFATLARSYSLEIGLPPDWQIAEDRSLGLLAQASVSAILSEEDSVALLQLMAKGASIRTANQLLMDSVQNLYDIYLDSRPGAWFQLDSVPSLTPAQLAEALDQLAAVAVEDQQMAKARNEDLNRAREENWDEFLKRGLATKILEGSDVYNRKPIPTSVRNVYRPILEHVRGLVTQQLKDATESTYRLLERYSVQFEASKLEAGQLDFDDVTRQLVGWFNPGGRPSKLPPRLEGEIEHLLLDEFQDTSPQQWRVLEPFARRVNKPNAPRSFFCVGDPKQAIYGWRGGVAEVFDLVERQFPNLQKASLTQSRRSSETIIRTVNAVFGNLNRYVTNNAQVNAVISRWHERFDVHSTLKNLPGYVVLERVPENEDSFAEVVQRIKSIYKRAPGRRIAVLTRDNDDVKQLIFRLHGEKIPASEEGGNPLTDSAAVLLILSLVHLADHPLDSICWFHLSGSPLAAAYAIPAYAQDPPAESIARVHGSAAAIRRDLAEQGYAQSVARWANILAASCTARELRRLQKLVELADRYESEATLRPSDFAEYVRAQRVEDPTGFPVRVMTIHKAKGLEFEIVVLPCLSKSFNPLPHDVMYWRESPTEPIALVSRYVNAEKRRLLPQKFQDAHDQQFERGMSEEICVLYVAMTRAISELHMFVQAKDAPTHQTLAAILLATLAPSDQAADKTPRKLFEQGDVVDTRASSEGDGPKEWLGTAGQPRVEAPRKPVILARIDPNSGRSLPLLHPSHLREYGRTIADHLAWNGRTETMERGTILHTCFAEVTWMEDSQWQDQLPQRLQKLFPGRANLNLLIDEFNRLLQTPSVTSLLHRTSYLSRVGPRILANQLIFEALTATAVNERPFAVRMDQAIVQGTIDRLVLIYEGDKLLAAEVIDYKTDDLPAADDAAIERRVDEYKPQIQAYRRAVAQFTNLPQEKVFARLLMLGIDREFEVR